MGCKRIKVTLLTVLKTPYRKTYNKKDITERMPCIQKCDVLNKKYLICLDKSILVFNKLLDN